MLFEFHLPFKFHLPFGIEVPDPLGWKYSSSSIYPSRWKNHSGPFTVQDGSACWVHLPFRFHLPFEFHLPFGIELPVRSIYLSVSIYPFGWKVSIKSIYHSGWKVIIRSIYPSGWKCSSDPFTFWVLFSLRDGNALWVPFTLRVGRTSQVHSPFEFHLPFGFCLPFGMEIPFGFHLPFKMEVSVGSI